MITNYKKPIARNSLSCVLVLTLTILSFTNSNQLIGQADLEADGEWHTIGATGYARNYKIPSDLSAGTYKISFRLLGADGGGAETPGYNCQAYGGDGAYVTASFQIGTGANELQPGGKLRFIPGKAGNTQTADLVSIGSGGGGSGLIYTTAESPSGDVPDLDIANASTQWVLLAVAGGGGGAFRAEVIVCYGAAHGEGGRASTSGGAGGAGGDGGTNGNGGDGSQGGGGAGVFGDGGPEDDGDYTNKGGVSGSGPSSTSIYSFGYGGGGILDEGAGGGGGYSGGGGGDLFENGGGGGSYVNSAANPSSKTDGGYTEYTSDDGYIDYRITQEGAPVAVCSDFVTKSISVYNSEIEITVDDIDNGSYDVGSGTLNMTIDNSDCTTLGLGSNLVTLTVTDNDGNVSTCQTHVVVTLASNSVSDLVESGGYITKNYSGSYQDFKIPTSGNFNQLCFILNGGDGGYASVGTLSFCPDCKSRGGYGAKAEVCYDIGCDTDELAPGSIVRFIIGGKGVSLDATEVACNGYGAGAGAGGTGLLYKEYGCNDWVVLAVAGGGGGAFQGQAGGFCTDSNAGGDGQTNVNGDGAGGTGTGLVSYGGTGGGGGSGGVDSGGGGGYYGDGNNVICGFDGSFGGGKKSGTTGGAGGSSNGTSCSGRLGGYGFGGGGMAWDVGGGGGGYSGGGPGRTSGGGGGGGSFVNLNYDVTYSIMVEPYTINPEDGYLKYRLNGGSAYGNETISASCKSTYTVELNSDGTAILFPNELDNGSSQNCADAGIYAQFIPNSLYLELDCNDVGIQTYTVGFYAVASGASSSSCTSSVTVTENQSPTAVCQDITLNLNSSGMASLTPEQLNGGSSDNCSIASYSASKTTFDCDNIGVNQVTLTVADAAGNTANCLAFVTIQQTSNLAPTAVCQDATVSLDESGDEYVGIFTIGSESTDDCGIASLSLSKNRFFCSDLGIATTILTVTDNSGQTATCQANVTVLDEIAPTAACQDRTIQLNTNGEATVLPGAVDGGSTDNCSITASSLSQSDFDCSHIGDNTVTLTVSDASGNSSTCTANIHIENNNPPTASCQAVTVQLASNGQVSVSADAVGGSSSVACGTATLALSQTDFNCTHVGNNSVTLTVTDNNGNTSSCGTTVTVQDLVAPLAFCRSFSIQLDNSGSASLTAVQVDNGSNDTCGAVSLSLDHTTLDCDDIGIKMVTLTVTDDHGNQSTCTSHVTVEDNIAPVANCRDRSLFLNVQTGIRHVSAQLINDGSTDNCDGLTLSSTKTLFDCTDVGNPTTVTLTVTDLGGNTSTCTAVVEIDDNKNPDAYCQDVTVVLDGNGSASVTPEEVDNESWDACGIGNLTLSQSSFDCTDIGSNQVTLIVTDNNGRTNSCTADVTVEDNQVPAFTICNSYIRSTNDGCNYTGAIGEEASPAMRFTDNCLPGDYHIYIEFLDETGNAFSPTLDLDLEDTNGSFIFNSETYPLGVNTISLTATDQGGNTQTCISTVTVVDNAAPTTLCTDLTIALDASGSALLPIAEVDNGSSDDCGMAGMALSQTNFDCSHVGTNTITLSATDVHGNTSTCAATITVQDVTNPETHCQDLTIQLDAGGSPITIGAHQVDGGSTDACGVANLALSQTAFDCSHVGDNSVTMTVTDNNGNTSTCGATVTVEDNTLPTPLCNALTVQLDGTGQGSISIADVDGGSSDVCGIASMELSQANFDCSDVGTVTVVLNVIDNNGNGNSCNTTITVVDQVAPVAVCQDVTVQLDAGGSATLAAGEVDGGSSDACGIPIATGMALSQMDFDCDEVGGNTITLTVTDNNGNSSTCTATVTVEDQIVPIAACQDVTVQLDAGGSATLAATTVDAGSGDACGVAHLDLNQTTFDCDEVGENTVTLTVTDEHGNSSSCAATVNVEDSVVPVAVCQDVTVQLDAGGSATLTPAQVDNGSTDACEVAEMTVNQSSFDCSEVGANIVTLVVTDNNGNTSSCTVAVTVEDSVGPVAACQDVTVQLDAGGSATLATQQVDDSSSDVCGISSLALSQMNFDCSEVGENVVTLTATDVNGNSGTCTATILVQDNITPQPVCLHPTITFNGEAQINVPISALYDSNASSDNCSNVSLLSPTSDQLIDCASVGALVEVPVVIADDSGNENQCIASIQVESLPCSWTDNGGIGCTSSSNDSSYDVGSDAFSLSADNCAQSFPYAEDQVAFVFTELCGDGEITALVTDVSGTGFAGVMMRDSEAPNAPMAAIGTNAVNRIQKQIRLLTGYPAYPQLVLAYNQFWLRLKRTGNMVQAYASIDGQTWTMYINQQVFMSNDCIKVGLYTYSEKPGNPITASFEQVSVMEGTTALASLPRNTTQSESAENQLDIAVFPNPTHDILNIDLRKHLEQRATLHLFNSLGQLVLEEHYEEAQSTQQLDVSALAPGVYQLVFQFSEGRVTKQVVIAKE